MTSELPGDIIVLPGDMISLDPKLHDISAAASSNLFPHGEEIFQEAARLYTAGQLEECRNQLQLLIAKDRALPHPDLVLIWMMLSDRKVAEAKRRLEKLAAVNPRDAQVVLTLGQVAFSEGRMADAAVHFEKSATLPLPEAWEEKQRTEFAVTIFDVLAAAYERQARWKDAQQVLASLYRLVPGNPAIVIRLARAHYHLNEKSKALELLELAATFSGNRSPASLLLAEIAFSAGRMDESAAAISEAVQNHGMNAHVQLWYAEWLLFRRDAPAALKTLEIVRQLGEPSAQYWISRGQALMTLGKFPDAVTAFQTVLKDSTRLQRPQKAAVENLLALSLVGANAASSHDEARKLVEENALQFPQDPVTIGTLGWIYLRCGRREEAQLMLMRALEISDRVSSDLSYFLADFYAADDQLQTEARQFLNAALEGTEGIFVMQFQALSLRDQLAPQGR